MKTQLTKICFFFLMLILPLSFVAAASLSYIPRVYLAGYGGNNSNLLGKADILAPVYLTANNNFFAYAQGKYAYENETWEDNTYTGSLGLGYRQIVKDTAVLGAYVFGDYTNSTSGHNFWVVSPGIEGLTRNWDFRANGYFPLDKTRWVDAGWASEFGYYHHLRYGVHSQYDHWYEYYQETGIGGDAEIGRNLYTLKGIFKGILFKGFVNGYYFNMKHNDDVIGGGARLTIQPNRSLKISLRDSYDNYEHNTFMVGVQLSFYDLITDNRNDPIDVQDLQRNLFVPIERNLATIGTGSSIPVTRSDNPEDAGTRLEHDNVWFFQSAPTASNSLGDGTYEHPFVGGEFNQTNINMIGNYTTTNGYARAYLYFSPGTYNAYTVGTPYLPIMLQPNQQMWGRMNGSKGFLEPAAGATRALFIGSLQLDTGDWLNNLRLQNDFSLTGFTEGVVMDGTTSSGTISNVAINDVVVGASDANTGYQIGIHADNATIDNISNSDVYAYSTTDDAYGLEAENTSSSNTGNVTVGNISGSNFTATSTDLNGVGYGLYIHFSGASGGIVTIGDISGSNFTGTGVLFGNGIDAASSNAGITIGTISDSNFSGTGGLTGEGIYVYAVNSNADITIGAISGSNFSGTGGNVGHGIYIKGELDVTIGAISGSSNFTGTGTADGGYGLYAESVFGAIKIADGGGISGSTFTGTGGLYGYGLSVRSSGITSIGSVAGDVNNSTFSGSGSATSVGMDLYGNTVNISGSAYVSGIVARNMLLTYANGFGSTPADQEVVIH